MMNTIKDLCAGWIWKRKKHLWRCANGRRMYFDQMTDSHLLNTLRMVEEGHHGAFDRQVWAELRVAVRDRRLSPLALRTAVEAAAQHEQWKHTQAAIKTIVPIGEVVDPDRRSVDRQTVHLIAVEIANGLSTPPVYVNRSMQIVDGLYRHAAYKQLGCGGIRIEIVQ